MSLTIVGGIYRERAVFPSEDVVYGSGGRAAVALKSLDPNVTLHSFVGEADKDVVSFQVDQNWQVNFVGYSVPEMVTFTYYHGLSKPVIRPVTLPFTSAQEIRVDAETILQFGMLEGHSRVDGNRVVYDPQNPLSPVRFDESGSTASELVYVLNRGEIRRLTGKTSVQEAAAELLARANVVAVLVKAGSDGCNVFTSDGAGHVPAYETPRIWPIGSGDVFAAVFAHFWCNERLQPLEAAQFASRGAAVYCNSKSLPLEQKQLLPENIGFAVLEPKRRPAEANIYLAGPFFTMSQLWLVEEARSALLDAGFRVFSPYHDVGVGDADLVVPSDIQGIESANVLFALCDGLDPGTLFEVGYAVKKGIPVVVFGEQTSTESMKMLQGTGCKLFKDFTSAVYHAQWEALK